MSWIIARLGEFYRACGREPLQVKFKEYPKTIPVYLEYDNGTLRLQHISPDEYMHYLRKR